MYNPDFFPGGEATCILCGFPHCLCNCSFNPHSYYNTHDKKKAEVASARDDKKTSSEEMTSSLH
ncbi:MAG: hypothetical protein WC435_01695 [Candidatus Paceibacterota bacterium]